MKLLLDTHAFIWMDSDPDRLPVSVREAVADRENAVLLSVVSIREMQIKHQAGKLTLRQSLREIIRQQQDNNQLEIVSVIPDHVFALEGLPDHHSDPFDRLLIAQTFFGEGTACDR